MNIKQTVLSFTLILLFSCSKEENKLMLNADYHQVADILEYCQGNCSETLDWEGSAVLIKGHIQDVENDSIVSEYYTDSRFYLSDIRNGMFMEVQVVGDKDAIFEIIYGTGKQDMVYVSGIAASVIVNEGNECMKGVVAELNKHENLSKNP